MLVLHLTFAQGHSLGLVVLNPKTSPLTWQLNMVLSDEMTAERGSSIWPAHRSPVHHRTKDESQKRLRKSPRMISLTCKNYNHRLQMLKQYQKKNRWELCKKAALHHSKRMCSPSPRFLIPHKLSIVVYRNPSKWPHSSSHALKALSPFPRRRWTAIHQYGMSGGSRIVKSSLVKMGAACWLAVFSIMRFDSSPPSSCSVSQHMTERMLPLNLLESWRKPSVNGSYVKRWSRSRRNSITWAFRLHNAQIHSDVPAVFVNIHEEWWAGQRNQGWKIEKYEKPLTSLTPHRCTF